MAEPSQRSKAPLARTEMLVRRPVSEVFEAFVEPDLLAKFWLFKSSGRLVQGARVRWDFIVHGAWTDVEVTELKRNERIVIRWSEGETVVFDFVARGAHQTFVKIENSGFSGSDAETVDKALDGTCGFTIVLCELKAVLEHGRALGFGPDKFPDVALNVERSPIAPASKPER
jgi:uncharacterized protein YndB with AHSA1/START domain